jgi:hypothetical protein
MRGSIVRDPVLELKIKENMLGSKKQQSLRLDLDLNKTYAEIWKLIRDRAGEAWQTQMQVFTQAALINQYQREYFVSADGAVRATLDYGLVAYEQRMASRPNLSRKLPATRVVVIEVKATPECHERLQEIMAHFPIQRSRSSKYVSGVQGGPF